MGELSASGVWLKRILRPQDVVWVLLFAALSLFGPLRTPAVVAPLAALGVLQVIEQRIPWFQSSTGGGASIALKLALCYLVMLTTGFRLARSGDQTELGIGLLIIGGFIAFSAVQQLRAAPIYRALEGRTVAEAMAAGPPSAPAWSTTP